MKNFYFSNVNLVLILFLAVSAAFAANLPADSKAADLVARDLSAKLKTELVAENLSVKLTSVEISAVSNSELVLKGDALAVLPKEQTELPIKFEARVNPVDEVVADIRYAFVESSSYAPTTEEEFLMRHLLQKIAADYKTENVVVAIDGFETENLNTDQKEFKGLAEVRIGDVEWKRIDFDIILNDKNEAAKVAYKVR